MLHPYNKAIIIAMKIKAAHEIVGAKQSGAPPSKPRRFLECFALPRRAANHVNADADFLARRSGRSIRVCN
jgi:hypothetical protein